MPTEGRAGAFRGYFVRGCSDERRGDMVRTGIVEKYKSCLSGVLRSFDWVESQYGCGFEGCDFYTHFYTLRQYFS
jgi:hypothetical protein